jgi:transcription-repair coupling factor (superfamily II helicase)
VSPAFLQDLASHTHRGLSGLPGGAAAFAISRLIAAADPLDEPPMALPLLVVVPEDIERLIVELTFHLRILGADVPVLALPGDDVRSLGGLSPHPDIPRQRLVALSALLEGSAVVIVASARALMHRVLGEETLLEHRLDLSIGDVIARDALLSELSRWGYLTTAAVEEVGCVSARGDVVDLWPTGEPAPVRLLFFDDEIEEIRRLDPSVRRRSESLESIRILPAREALISDAALERASEQTALAVDAMGDGHALRRRVLTELKAGLWFPGAEDYLPALHELVEPLSLVERVVVVEPSEVIGELRRFDELISTRLAVRSEPPVVLPGLRYVRADTVIKALTGATPLGTLIPEAPDYGASPNDPLRVGGGDLAPTAARLRQWMDDGWQIGLVCDSHARAERVMALLAPHDLHPAPMPAAGLPQGRLSMVIGTLPRGFHAPRSQLAWVSADELFGVKSRPARVPRSLREATLSSFAELKSGDLVVHARHGIGRFIGLKRLQIGGVLQDYAEAEYRGGDRMYLPVTRLDQLFRYRAVGDAEPRLDKLGGETWTLRRKKVSDRILAMATELLAMHAARTVTPGHAYIGTPPLYHQLVETFPYVETPDQERAIDEVLADLAGDDPMDRLIVGDVGFGKTEVAIRAAMRVVLEGHQVAVLCPTTVLAFQHADTFRSRFAEFPVRIELLSRFRSPAQVREVLTDLRAGKVDIVIGTSSLLSRQLKFAHLGLVVVDEEHRFGVRQKEKLKRLQPGMEYLAMSATPIPRTLHMAMSGLRDISMIATPPPGRRAVRTHLFPYSEERIVEQIRFELSRGGQVFYVHNRVESIHQQAARLQALLPEVSMAVAHGQMDRGELEDVLVGFVRRRVHVLVTTTIIESGIDLPAVNTMIIERADQLGLAQLYQLRGRVGRGMVKGVCSLMVPADGTLATQAMQRMRVIQENTELGAGFSIASADMELRGSGNLLGKNQHGHIQSVGLDTYVELLEEAAASASGEMTRRRLDPELEIPVSALIPDDYMPDIEERLSAYRRIATASSRPAVRDLISSWEDTWGEPPPEVLNLGWSAEAKLRCRDLGIDRIDWLGVRVVLRFHETTTVPPQRLADLAGGNPRRFSVGSSSSGGTTLTVRFTPAEGEWPFRFLHWVFRELERPEAE